MNVPAVSEARGPLTPVLRMKLMAVHRARAIPQTVNTTIDALRSGHANFVRYSPGLRLLETRIADVQIARDAYAGYGRVPLPTFLLRQRAAANVKAHDYRCYVYAILSALHPLVTRMDRPMEYDQYFAQHPALNALE